MSSEGRKNPAAPELPRSTSGSSAWPRLAEGAVLGDYELRSEVGRGGMGTVYEAWQRSLQRIVALKVLGAHVADSPNAVLRFQQEARAAAKLHHTQIVPIYDQGEQDGVYFYAMELIKGESVSSIIAKLRDGNAPSHAPTATDPDATVALAPKRPPVSSSAETVATVAQPDSCDGLSDSGVTLVTPSERACTPEHFHVIAKQLAAVADALDYAHGQGVIHRDIKPHNLIRSTDGRVVVSDFGLARLAEQPGVTVTGEMLGSPLYMSAEQISQGPSKVDNRTDIYSLGATMYEYMTLSPPFPGETRERVINLILNTEAPKPRLLNPSIPVDLETICLKAMERDPDKRYQTAGQMRDDLIRFGLGEPVRARRAGVLRRVRKFINRHQVGSMAVAAVGVALALTIALVFSWGEIEKQDASLAERAAEEDKLMDYVNYASTREIIGSVSPEVALIGMTAEAVGPVFQNLINTGQKVTLSGENVPPGPDPLSTATPQGIARRSVDELFNADLADHHQSQPISPSAASPEDLVLQIEQSFIEQADEATGNQHKYDLLAQALALNPNNTLCRHRLIVLCCKLKRLEEMLVQAQQLIDIEGEGEYAIMWRGIAKLLLDQNDGALADFSAVVQRNGLSPWARMYRGLALVETGRAEEAILELNNALSLEPGLVLALLGRATAQAKAGHIEEATADLTRALALAPDDADILAARGTYYNTLSRFAEAEQDLDRAMSIAGKSPAMVMQYFFARAGRRNAEQESTVSAPPDDSDVTDRPLPREDQSSELESQGWFDRLINGPRNNGKGSDRRPDQAPGYPLSAPSPIAQATPRWNN